MDDLGNALGTAFVQLDALDGLSRDVTEVGWEQCCELLFLVPLFDATWVG